MIRFALACLALAALCFGIGYVGVDADPHRCVKLADAIVIGGSCP